MPRRRYHKPLTLRNRVQGVESVRLADLAPAPHNWRTHPPDQRSAVIASIRELGLIEPLKARRLPDGRLQLWDGHLRLEELTAALSPDAEVPVLVTDLDDAEAKKANLLADPLAGMAGADAGKLDALLREVETGDPALADMLDGLAKDAGLLGGADGDGGSGGDAAEQPERFNVLIECDDEGQQAELLERLEAEGLRVRSLIS
jgi:ParB-like chromosome segregation protein Spo0J